MKLEREYRFSVNEENLTKIKMLSRPKKPVDRVTDLVMGYYGFNSLDRLGYICRIRQKKGKTVLECKKRMDSNTWQEQQITLDSIKQGYNFLSALGLKPYLLLDRQREVRETEDFILALDDVEMLGKFVEIELKDIESSDNEKKLQQFLVECKISGKAQKLYGDIFKEKIENDATFKNTFEKSLGRVLESL